ITNGHGPETKVVYVVKNSLLTLPPDLIAEGYTLKGVFKDKGLNQEWNIATDKVTSETTLYAKWEINSHTISFLVDGAPISSATLEYGAEVVAPTPSKTGYTFVWDEDAPATMPDKDLVINGSYTINTHRLVYKLNGEEYNVENVTYGTKLTLLDSPSAREGHTFSGWSTLPSTMPDNDVTVTGSFDANKHTILFTINSETIQTTNTEFGANISSLLPKKPGFRFVPANDIPTTMPDKDLTITGSWQERTYRLTYKINGEEHQHFDLNYGDAITPLAALTKTGYTFSGWSEIPQTMPDDDITITGSFNANEHTITYMIDGEVYKTTKTTFGSKIILPTTPFKAGLKFSGWSNIPETMPDNDITITGSFSSATPVAEITENEDIKVWSYNRTIYIETAPDTKYKIIDINGRILTTSTTKSTHDEIQISQTGVLIVIINNHSFKLFN
ncbi:MAG: InlB B-repeat-containing protein, partial [Bacteroidales bacterium]|nr:InlB B-repeat-containing protein [Bacteroidales bacterium]